MHGPTRSRQLSRKPHHLILEHLDSQHASFYWNIEVTSQNISSLVLRSDQPALSKAGKRVYMLYQLKRAGISQLDLVKIYVSVIRPVLEYACPVWSTNLPKYLSDAIEMIQKRVLRSIYPGLHYDDILVLVSLQSLKKRRDDICKAYFNRLKCNTHRLHHLIPERRDVHYRLRNANVYPIPVTRTDRYKNSIVPWGLCNWQ